MLIEVQLRAARIPGIPGFFADHYWFLVRRSINGTSYFNCDRWEIWQHTHQNVYSWGYLHKNLLKPYEGVGNGPSQLVKRWLNDEAMSIVQRIESSPIYYPFIDKYRYWPGPNSNTFAQWIVCNHMKLGCRAIGKNFPVPFS